jgi:diguanylate cyclase (GGDEF)-like protein
MVVAMLPGFPHRWTYAVLGAALSLGAPLGLCLLRALQSPLPFLSCLRADPSTYLYVFLSTFIVFSAFGFALGRQADRFADLSSTDPLTGLRNRRALYERLEGEIARAARYGQPLSLLLIDVDGLKEINDRDGHRAGDAALRDVAAAVRDGSRAADLGARWGGDEFALLAPSTSVEAASGLAERVRLLVVENARSGGRSRATVSVGVAIFDLSGPPPTPEALVLQADEALYEAKRAGRPRIARSADRAPR